MSEFESISRFENSLTDFLISIQSSRYEDVTSFSYKYNNLKFFMAPTKVREPHFFVRLGISEACFSIETGNKLEGSLGPEDRMVQKWANRINTHRELETFWKDLSLKSRMKKDAMERKSERDADIGKEHPINIMGFFVSLYSTPAS